MTYLHPVFALALIVTVLGVFLRDHVRKNRLFPVAAVILMLLSWTPAACIAVTPFELPYSRQPPADRSAQAIVILSARVLRAAPPLPVPVADLGTYERCQYAAWLYKHWLAVPVLASGQGSGPAKPYSAAMAKVLEEAGVPESMIWQEDNSISTYENALFSARILRQKGIHRIALVTEAYHMFRAQKCFEKQGLAVIPAACGFRSDLGWSIETLLPSSQAIEWNGDVVHESAGLLWYYLRGWI